MAAEERPANEVLAYGQEIDIESITGVGEITPEGRYRCRLQAVNAKTSNQDKPMVEVTWDIREGEREGLEIRQFFTMYASKNPKTGRIFAPGLAEEKEIFKRVGAAVEGTLTTDMHRNAKTFANAMRPSSVGDVEILVKHEKVIDKETKKPVLKDDNSGEYATRARVIVVGRWKDSSSATGAVAASIAGQQASDPLAGLSV